MTEKKTEKEPPAEHIEDIIVKDTRRDKRLNKEQSSQNPDRVEDYNRRADRRREEYSRANYDESQSDTGE